MGEPVKSLLYRLIDRAFLATPAARRLQRELAATTRTATEALRLATESARAVERLLQAEVELKRELSALGAAPTGEYGRQVPSQGTAAERDR